ncbi:MAG: hypothetical protein ACRCXD_11290 [Luteolibacter sp.]
MKGISFFSKSLLISFLAATGVLHATPIQSGSDVTGSFSLVDPVDSYTIQATAGSAIRAGLGILTGTVQPYIEIVSPTGTSLDVGFDSTGNGTNAIATAPVTGTYTILVSDSNNDQTGTYRLSVVTAPAAIAVTDDNRLDVVSGSDLEGSLEKGDYDVFTIQATAGAVIRAGLGILTGTADPYVEIVSPSGASLDVGFDSTGNGTNAIATAPVTGTYTILVSDSNNDQTGTYRLSVVTAPAAFIARGSNTSLSSGVGVTASLAKGDFDMHVFGGITGDNVNIALSQLAAIGFSARFELISPSGQSVLSRSSGNYNYQLSETGTYFLLVSDSSSDAPGTYTISASGFTGSANVTFVSPSIVPPELEIVHLPDGSVEVSWPLVPAGWVLQSSISLDSATFSDRNTLTDASRNFLRIANPSGREFFRLRN